MFQLDKPIVKRRLSAEDQEKAVERYKNGESLNKICAGMLICNTTLWRYLKRRGIERNRKILWKEFDIHIFDDINTEEKAYWLGFIAADGSNLIEYNRITLNLAETDKNHLFKFCSFMKTEPKFTMITRKNIKNAQRQFSVSLSNKHCSQTLLHLGIVPNKTFELKFPTNLSFKMIRHFIRGYFDGDGSIGLKFYKNGYRPLFYVNMIGTDFIINGMANHIKQESGIDFKIWQSKKQTHNNIFEMSIAGNKVSKQFLDWLYSDASIWLDRKYERYKLLCEINSIGIKKKVRQLDTDGNIISIFEDAHVAAAAVNRSHTSIEHACRNIYGKRKTNFCAGYIWEYENIEDKYKKYYDNELKYRENYRNKPVYV